MSPSCPCSLSGSAGGRVVLNVARQARPPDSRSAICPIPVAHHVVGLISSKRVPECPRRARRVDPVRSLPSTPPRPTSRSAQVKRISRTDRAVLARRVHPPRRPRCRPQQAISPDSRRCAGVMQSRRSRSAETPGERDPPCRARRPTSKPPRPTPHRAGMTVADADGAVGAGRRGAAQRRHPRLPAHAPRRTPSIAQARFGARRSPSGADAHRAVGAFRLGVASGHAGPADQPSDSRTAQAPPIRSRRSPEPQRSGLGVTLE